MYLRSDQDLSSEPSGQRLAEKGWVGSKCYARGISHSSVVGKERRRELLSAKVSGNRRGCLFQLHDVARNIGFTRVPIEGMSNYVPVFQAQCCRDQVLDSRTRVSGGSKMVGYGE